MGFLGIIPASKLAATYNIFTQTLTLTAEGTVMEATYGYQFLRLPWVGGLKFRLQAWTGPLTGKNTTYDFSQNFRMSLFPYVKYVFIEDAGHPNGVEVKIEFIGPVDPLPELTASVEDDTPTASADKEILAPPQDVINVLYKEPFTIKQPDETPKFGSIDLQFDATFLVLETSGIDNGNIFWTFNSLQTGYTQVIVTLHGGISQLIKRILYDVHIFFLPLEPGPVIINDAPKGDSNQDLILGFLGRVQIARRQVMEKYPDALLFNAEASTTAPQGVISPYLLVHMLLVFRADKGIVTIKSTGYDTFGPPVYKEGIWLGTANIDWPVGMDALEADEILKKSGITGPYTSLNLVKPLGPGLDDDYYQFKMVDGSVHWIDTKTKALKKE
jgi:hypothetical protein